MAASMTDRCVYLTVLATSLATAGAAYGGGVLYVDDDAPPGGDGTSWNTAYRFLQDAMTDAGGGGIAGIRVGQGIYTPDRDKANPDGTGDRQATFQLLNGVALMGGYAGIGADNPDERDIDLYETTLSGDLLGDDLPKFGNNEENSYHVVTGSGTDSTAVIDGVTVTGGYADGEPGDPESRGGGMFIEAGSPRLSSCKFTASSAQSGGAVFMIQSNPEIVDCTFTENLSTALGGAMYIHMVSSPKLLNCSFINNASLFSAGAVYNGLGNNVPVLTECTFIENTAERAGGLNSLSGLILQSCMFVRNHSTDGSGGAVSANYVLALGCTFVENVASKDGGGVTSSGAYSTFIDCIFERNTASENGGGFRSDYQARTMLLNCTFEENTAAIGGALIHNARHLRVVNCEFLNNSAMSTNGGAIYSSPNSNGNNPGAEFTNCRISGNTAPGAGGGLYIVESPSVSIALANCTIVANSGGVNGGGVFAQGSPSLTNCIVYSNAGGAIEGDGSVVSYSNIEGGYLGEGNIDADPLFIDPDNDDYRLSPGSPCIDAANNWGVPVDDDDYDEDGVVCELFPSDLDGNPRFNADEADFDPGCGIPVVVDMGAYEYQFDPIENVIFADLNADGAVGVADLLGLLASWGPCGKGCCLADLDIDSNVGISDLLALLANWGPCP